MRPRLDEHIIHLARPSMRVQTNYCMFCLLLLVTTGCFMMPIRLDIEIDVPERDPPRFVAGPDSRALDCANQASPQFVAELTQRLRQIRTRSPMAFLVVFASSGADKVCADHIAKWVGIGQEHEARVRVIIRPEAGKAEIAISNYTDTKTSKVLASRIEKTVIPLLTSHPQAAQTQIIALLTDLTRPDSENFGKPLYQREKIRL